MTDIFIQRLAAQLSFAAEQVRRLDTNAAYWPDSGHATIRLRDKVATEAAMLLLLARRAEAACPELAPFNDALAAPLLREIRSDRLRGLILRQPHVAATLGAGSVFLSAAGHGDPAFDRLIEDSLNAGFGQCVERVPYRQLDQLWTRNLLAAAPQPLDAVLAGSILHSRAHPFYMTEADAYAVTHAILYATDFGRAPPPASLDRTRLSEMVHEGIAWSMVSEDFDLLIEYLMCAACLGETGGPAACLGWHVVDRIWKQLGFLPGPTFDPQEFRARSGPAADAYACEQMYHTNFVAGMYCAMRLGLPAPEAAVPPCHEAGGHETLERLLGLGLAIAGACIRPDSPWFQALESAPLEDEDLAAILWDALAIAATRHIDRPVMDRLARDAALSTGRTPHELRWLIDRLDGAFSSPVAMAHAA
ncbi:hypothetical protein ASE00_01230 [Sphingomonas sp. Root710]|uniref:DUF6895 family protein n=1 Tax=Sphingomonas sp. Root710 TaxID=1736594 RepID=UPI0007000CF0|nr:hypothetical protein [Sphingomonas sp. Root710]KRB85449.1 hypothetical protein ASE00_01230 [Sphingomonas sp. Root710]